MIGIYCIRHKESGKCYIGQSVDIPIRLRHHKNGLSRCPYIQNAIQKYGVDAFAFEVLELCAESDLNNRERFWIVTLNTLSPHGYNLQTGGDSGGRLSAEARAKMSQSKLGNQNTKGNTLSVEHRENISKGLKGKTDGEKNGMYGRRLTPEHRQALSETHKGKPKSAKQRSKMSQAQRGEKNHNYGKTASAETRAKMRKSHKNRPSQSAETRKKRSESVKRWCAERKAKQRQQQLTLFD
jgi:group I intron endonuclease